MSFIAATSARVEVAAAQTADAPAAAVTAGPATAGPGSSSGPSPSPSSRSGPGSSSGPSPGSSPSSSSGSSPSSSSGPSSGSCSGPRAPRAAARTCRVAAGIRPRARPRADAARASAGGGPLRIAAPDHPHEREVDTGHRARTIKAHAPDGSARARWRQAIEAPHRAERAMGYNDRPWFRSRAVHRIFARAAPDGC